MGVPDRPLVSLVMPSLDQARFLGQALHSVLTQEGDFDLDCIVMDGGSTDGSLSVLDELGDAIRYVSGPDSGQSSALNKGFALARGDIFGWLNSDDLMAPGALQRVVGVFEREPEVQFLYGKVLIVDDRGRVTRRAITAYKNLRMRRFRYGSLLTENWISQMGVFWRRAAHEEVGPFREDLHLTMDYDFWLRLAERWPGRFVDEYLAAFRWYATTKTGRRSSEMQRESVCVATAHAAGAYPGRIAMHRVNAARTILAYRALRALAAPGRRG